MQRWEYSFHTVNNQDLGPTSPGLEEVFASKGAEGWEFIATTPTGHGLKFIFKRPVPPAA